MKLPCIGVDISKDWFDVHVPGYNLKMQLANDLKGFKTLLRVLKKHKIQRARVCMEATGLLWESLAEFLVAKGHEVVVVNPQCIKSYARSELRRSKSDPLDAEMIARYCEDKYARLNLWQPMRAEYKEVRGLLRRRTDLIADRTAELCRKKAGFTSPEIIASIKHKIEWLDQEIKRLETLVKKLIRTTPELREAVRLLESIVGIQWLTAATVLVEVPEILWSGRLAAAYAGLVPHQDSSGKRKRFTYLSRIGNARLRHALYMPAVVASHRNELLKAFYQRLLNRGLKKKQAIAAVMRKMLHLIFGVLKNKAPFDPKFELKRRQLASSAH